MQSPKLIIFDCDGVLVDSEAISARILVTELAKFDVIVSVQEVFDNFVGRSLTDVVESLHISPASDTFSSFNVSYHVALLAALASELKAMPGIRDVVSRLNVPFCVASSSSRQRILNSLALADLAALFGKNVFSASQVSNGKPAPDLFLFAAGQMGVTPDACLVIEDSLPGVQAAHAANMPVWRFTGGSHFAKTRLDLADRSPAIPAFDAWESFFELAPNLKAQ